MGRPGELGRRAQMGPVAGQGMVAQRRYNLPPLVWHSDFPAYFGTPSKRSRSRFDNDEHIKSGDAKMKHGLKMRKLQRTSSHRYALLR